MSTAIMHTGALYDFGDLHLKNQATSLSMSSHLQQQTNNNVSATNNINNNNNNNKQLANANLMINTNNNARIQSHVMMTLQSDHSPIASPPPTPVSTSALGAIGQQQQQQQQHPLAASLIQQQLLQAQSQMLHSALTRAASHPQGSNISSIIGSLFENLGQQHRKLERTQSEPLPQQGNTSRYKTELCRPFEEAGECKYGEKCQFAHGFHELRNLQRHPKYKTEQCRTFHSVGFCPYGPRCHFVHNAEEARNHNRAVHAYIQQMNAVAAAAAAAKAAAPSVGGMMQSHQYHHQHSLPLTPPMSMSTGSDRASPVGSLSPTNSMGSFFPDQLSPTTMQQHHQAFNYGGQQTPPISPGRGNSPAQSPPPQSGASSASSISSEEARLPIFNQISSLDAFTNLVI